MAAIGLVENVKDTPFQCGTCEFFKDDKCYNKHPKLNRRDVKEEWCCNLYHHDGMITIVD